MSAITPTWLVAMSITIVLGDQNGSRDIKNMVMMIAELDSQIGMADKIYNYGQSP